MFLKKNKSQKRDKLKNSTSKIKYILNKRIYSMKKGGAVKLANGDINEATLQLYLAGINMDSPIDNSASNEAARLEITRQLELKEKKNKDFAELQKIMEEKDPKKRSDMINKWIQDHTQYKIDKLLVKAAANAAEAAAKAVAEDKATAEAARLAAEANANAKAVANAAEAKIANAAEAARLANAAKAAANAEARLAEEARLANAAKAAANAEAKIANAAEAARLAKAAANAEARLAEEARLAKAANANAANANAANANAANANAANANANAANANAKAVANAAEAANANAKAVANAAEAARANAEAARLANAEAARLANAAKATARATKKSKKSVSFINGPPNPVKSTFQCTNEKGQICCKTTI